MTIDLTFTTQDYSLLVAILNVALAANLGYHVFKGSNDMKELAYATIGAEIFLFLMWLALVGLHNM